MRSTKITMRMIKYVKCLAKMHVRHDRHMTELIRENSKVMEFSKHAASIFSSKSGLAGIVSIFVP